MGLSFSNPADDQEERPENSAQPLLSSAAEIVARQRLAEQLDRVSSSSQSTIPSPGPSTRRSPLTPTTTSSRRTYQSIADLLADLLSRDQLALDNQWPFAHRNLGMHAGEDATSSSSDEEVPMVANLASICARPALPAHTKGATPQLKQSYKNLRNDISLRCGLCDYRKEKTKTSLPQGAPIVTAVLGREMNDGRGCLTRPSASIRCRPYAGGFTKAQRVMLNNRYLPNRRRKVDGIRAKTFCVSYVDGGQGIMTASQDHKIRLYHPVGPRRRYERTKTLDVPYVGWSILDVTVSPDGRDVVYSTWNESMYQCNIHDKHDNWRTLRVEASDARFALFSMRFNADGTEIVAGSTDRHLYIYSRELGKCVLALPAHEDDINAVCFGDNDSHIILSAGDDGLCKVWDRRVMAEFGGARPVGTFAGHRDGVTFIDSRGDDRYLLTNSKDQTIKLWDMRCFASDEAIVRMVSARNAIQFPVQEATKNAVRGQKWDYRWQCCPPENYNSNPLPGDASLLTLRGHSVLHTLIRARFSPDHTGKRYVYTGCARGGCRVLDIFTGETVKVYDGHRGVVRDCMWHPYHNEIVTTSWDGETSIWRYDERAVRNINPESPAEVVGDEDSCDEKYDPVESFKIRRCRPGQGPIASRTRNALTRAEELKTESDDDEEDGFDDLS